MPINNCNDKLRALIEEFGEEAVKNAMTKNGLNNGLIYNVDKGYNTIDFIDREHYPHNHTLHAAVGFAGSHASFRMARDMGFSIDDSVDELGNFYSHVRARSAFIEPSEESKDFTFNFFERMFMNSKLKNYLILEKEKAEKYKELESEDFVGLWDNHVEEDSETYNKPYNIFRKRKGLPAIELTVGDVYFINLGKGDESRIVKMRLQKIKNEDHTFPELYFSLEDCRTLKHNATHINIGMFKIINKKVSNEHNKN